MKETLETACAIAWRKPGAPAARFRSRRPMPRRRRGRTRSPSRTGWPSSSRDRCVGLEGRRRGPRRADSGRARRPDHRAHARVEDLCEPGAGSGGDVRRLQDRVRVRVPFPAGRSGARARLHALRARAAARFPSGARARRLALRHWHRRTQIHDPRCDRRQRRGRRLRRRRRHRRLAWHRFRAHDHRRADRRRGSDRGLYRRVPPRSGRHSRRNGQRPGRARHRPCRRRPAVDRLAHACRRRCAGGRRTSRASAISRRSP